MEPGESTGRGPHARIAVFKAEVFFSMLHAALIGFPATGKSTLFQLMTSSKDAPRAKAETVVGISKVPDPRLDRLTAMFNPLPAIALLPLALTNKYFYDIAVLVGLNAIVCVGLNLLIGYAGQISLGHAGFFGLGAYGSAILASRYGWVSLPGQYRVFDNDFIIGAG